MPCSTLLPYQNALTDPLCGVLLRSTPPPSTAPPPPFLATQQVSRAHDKRDLYNNCIVSQLSQNKYCLSQTWCEYFAAKALLNLQQKTSKTILRNFAWQKNAYCVIQSQCGVKCITGKVHQVCNWHKIYSKDLLNKNIKVRQCSHVLDKKQSKLAKQSKLVAQSKLASQTYCNIKANWTTKTMLEL